MNEKDFHEKCSHCTTVNVPMWPIHDFDAWKVDICHGQAVTEAAEGRVELSKKQKEDRLNLEVQKKNNVEKQKRDRKNNLTRIIKEQGSNLLNIKIGGTQNMKTEKALKKTAVLDALIRADVAASYEEGASTRIVAQVLSQFEGLEEKKIISLFYSRRAVARKAAETAATEATTV